MDETIYRKSMENMDRAERMFIEVWTSFSDEQKKDINRRVTKEQDKYAIERRAYRKLREENENLRYELKNKTGCAFLTEEESEEYFCEYDKVNHEKVNIIKQAVELLKNLGKTYMILDVLGLIKILEKGL